MAEKILQRKRGLCGLFVFSGLEGTLEYGLREGVERRFFLSSSGRRASRSLDRGVRRFADGIVIVMTTFVHVDEVHAIVKNPLHNASAILPTSYFHPPPSLSSTTTRSHQEVPLYTTSAISPVLPRGTLLLSRLYAAIMSLMGLSPSSSSGYVSISSTYSSPRQSQCFVPITSLYGPRGMSRISRGIIGKLSYWIF
jgi:hypothetical protein